MYGLLTVKPLNISANVGDSVSMSCRTSLTAAVEWRRKLLSADRFEIFCYHGRVTEGHEDKFSISNPETGSYVVTIKNIQLNDSGEYQCIEGVDTNPNYGTIFLRVIGNDFCFSRFLKQILIFFFYSILHWSIAVSTLPVVTNSCLPPGRCKANVLLAKVCLHCTKPGVAGSS